MRRAAAQSKMTTMPAPMTAIAPMSVAMTAATYDARSAEPQSLLDLAGEMREVVERRRGARGPRRVRAPVYTGAGGGGAQGGLPGRCPQSE
jgi:hypothetical protein